MRTDGRVVCWGDDRGGQASPPNGEFVAISAAGELACGLRLGGEAECWGNHGPSPPPLAGPFAAISAHGWRVCGLRLDAGAQCWYRGDGTWRHHAPPGTFVAITASDRHACGIRLDETLECWSPRWPPGAGVPDADASDAEASAGSPGDGVGVVSKPSRGVPRELAWVLGDMPAGPFVALDADGRHACGLRADGTVACWARAPSAQRCRVDAVGETSCPAPTVVEPEGTYERIAVGWGYECGIRPDATVACWLASDGDPPVGAFEALDAAWRTACGLRRGGDEIVCWGLEQRTHQGDFTKIRIGYSSIAAGAPVAGVCALRSDGGAECRGHPDVDFFTPPPPWIPGAPYSDIAVGFLHACALRADGGGVLCWGDNRSGQTDAPGGAYTAIVAGYWHTCALGADGEVTCWGDGPYNDRYADAPEHISTDPPPGPYTAVTAGDHFTCALRADGEATCWLSY